MTTLDPVGAPAPFFNCLAQCGDFGQPEGGPTSISKSYMKNWSAGQLKLEGWGGVAYFWTSTCQVYLVGFIQLTILSGQGHFSELVVQTHKVILASSSPSFQNLLKRNKYPHPLI